MRTLTAAALVIVSCAPVTARAQQAAFPSPVAVTRADSSCTYDRCALRLEPGDGWHGGIVRGGTGDEVGRIGVFRPNLSELVRGDSATLHARRFDRSYAIGVWGVGIGGALSVLPLARKLSDSSRRPNGGDVAMVVGGLVIETVGARYLVTAELAAPRFAPRFVHGPSNGGSMWEPGKPSQSENEYFAKRDAEWLKERRAQLDAERAAAPQRLRCPRDGGDLEERLVKNMRIDVCPKCHGVWLDTGELEMVLHLPRAELLRAVADVESGKASK